MDGYAEHLTEADLRLLSAVAPMVGGAKTALARDPAATMATTIPASDSTLGKRAMAFPHVGRRVRFSYPAGCR